MSGFLKPLTVKVNGMLHPAAPAAGSAGALALVAPAAPAGSGGSLLTWSLVAAVVAAVVYFFTKSGDNRSKHRY